MQPNPIDTAVSGTVLGSGAAWLIALAAVLVIGFMLFYWRRSRARSLSQRLQHPEVGVGQTAAPSARTP